jgi:predicted O-linked N-acetylglucosamine transferase (SPINDLY family)
VLARAQFERALALDPNNAEFLKSLGNAQKAMGEGERAIESYRRSLDCAPDYAPALYNLGLILRETGRLDEAERYFRRLFEIDPRDADALFHLGSLLGRRSEFSDAARMYQLALEQKPDNPHLWHELGLAYRNLGRAREAAAAFRKALELEPNSFEAHNNLGNLLQDQGALDEAAAHYSEAIGLAPGSAAAHNNLGCTRVRQNRLGEALECFCSAVEIEPEFAAAQLNLGSVHALLGARDRALRCYETALRLQPDDAAARECLLFEMQNVCDWSRFSELSEIQRRTVRERPEEPISPFSLLSIPSSPAEQLHCAANFARRYAAAVRSERAHGNAPVERGPKPRLTIGYLSADLHEHATAYLAAELFELHDRAAFNIIAYSYGPDDGSPMRQRLRRAFDRFVDIAALSHADAAAAVRNDAVDILVDLKGYTQHARSEIMALRAAPVQVSYLGYPGTMGADFIDYLIADRFVVPLEQQQHYSEKLVFMPGSYQVNDRNRRISATPPRAELGLPERGFVFCCFNQTYKILPDVFATWSRLLLSIPGSVLWLLEGNPWATLNLRREAADRGIAPERLIFAPRVALEAHLGRLRAADLFLDTLPYNAHTTASDALWAGLPVLTCAGDTFASRVAGSLLTAVGLPELITRSLPEYEALALRLAREPGALASLREKLWGNRVTSALFDTPSFVRNLEAGYRQMWANYVAAEPRSIVL